MKTPTRRAGHEGIRFATDGAGDWEHVPSPTGSVVDLDIPSYGTIPRYIQPGHPTDAGPTGVICDLRGRRTSLKLTCHDVRC